MKYNVKKREIILDRELSNLDKFALKFIRVMEKHTGYVIISGYISIVLGRARATEDIDIFIKRIPYDAFYRMYEDLLRNGFWCINAEEKKEVFSYLNEGLAVRFAKKGSSIPNFEVKFPKRGADEDAFKDSIKLRLNRGSIIISSLERQIAFKRYYLSADKDIEDALHIEEIFGEKIDHEKINKLKDAITRIKEDETRKSGK